ncbi:hypothetical protein [Nostoc sp.]|uniref:hypothetical protein n=1 Tax=Nostoc sp. TaxID=1180 RepID=UPI002FF476BC
MKCWRFSGQGVNNDAYYEYFACGTSATFQAMEGGQALFLDGSRLGGGGFVYRNGSQSASAVNDATPTPGYNTYGECNACKVVIVLYDCINGACTPSTTYKTPGLYSDMNACELACGTGCSGKCISNSDWAQIEGLASQLKNHEC